jgi:glycosidase
MKDFGYDIEDFKDVDESFGSLQDFKDLVKAMRKKGMQQVGCDIDVHQSSTASKFYTKHIISHSIVP